MQQTMCGIYKSTPGPGAEYRTDLPIPEIGSDELLLRVCAAAICGTDQHIYSWNSWAQERVPLPMVFGHELSGDVVAVGKHVHGFRIGDRIAVETHIPCGRCHSCRTGHQHNCEEMKIIGVHVAGGFAEYVRVPQSCAWKLAPHISYRHGAMLEPMGVAVHGVFSGKIAMQNVVILGCGPIGIMGIGAAHSGGAAGILAVDVFDEKLEMAKKMGARRLVNTCMEDPVEAILDWTDGRGADVILDFTGNVSLIESAFRALCKNGRFTLVGLPSQKLSLDLTNAVIYKEANINGVTGRKMYETWYQCSRILEKGDMDLDSVIGGVYDMKDYSRAFADIIAGKPGKMLLLTPYGRQREQEGASK